MTGMIMKTLRLLLRSWAKRATQVKNGDKQRGLQAGHLALWPCTIYCYCSSLKLFSCLLICLLTNLLTYLLRFGNVSNISPTTGRNDISTNMNNILGYQDQSRTASAKQHYLKQSRYLPGKLVTHIVPKQLRIFLVYYFGQACMCSCPQIMTARLFFQSLFPQG